MRPIRVLIVDDSVVVRQIVSRVVSEDPVLEVVGVAANGRIALSKIAMLSPDIIVLDVEMPELDGLATLAEIRKTQPDLPVIMFSTVTERGATATLDALAIGANDYVTKPQQVAELREGMKHVREKLIPRIKALCSRGARTAPTITRRTDPPATAARTHRPARRSNRHVEVVVIGVSTGGPNALVDLLPSFPADFPVPILIVQHMPAMFTKLLADRLDARCALTVREGVTGRTLEAGDVWLAVGGRQMAVADCGGGASLVIHDGPPLHSCRPAADVLFHSAAKCFGSGVVAVVLTGMGRDGHDGCESVRNAGGQIIAQDEPSSVVWGMPGFVARDGLADAVLPLDQIADEIITRTWRRRTVAATP